MIVINLQLERGHKIYWFFLCKSKERFYKTCEVIGIFLKKPSSGWKKRFWPVFLVLPVMLLKTQLFEKEPFCPSFLVLCSNKNLSEQFIPTHIVSRHFFCIIKLHSVRTNEADGDLFKKMLSSRWFWLVFSRGTEYRDVKKQFHWPKNDSINYCASYKIISATTGWMLKTKNSKKKLPFQWKRNTFTFFSRSTEFCRRP